MARTPKEPKEPKEEGAKRHWLSARTTAELNQALKDASAKSGRSVSQEIELRLEASFKAEKAKIEAEEKNPIRPYDQKTQDLFKSIQLAAGAAMTKIDASWATDIYARAAVQSAIHHVMASYIKGNPINIFADDFDIEKLDKARRLGATFAHLFGTRDDWGNSDELLQQVRDRMFGDNRGLLDLMASDDVRRDAALSELNVSLAA